VRENLNKDSFILVIGGTGFIGIFLSKKLVEEGFSNITVFGHKPKYKEVKGVSYVYGNILDKNGW